MPQENNRGNRETSVILQSVMHYGGAETEGVEGTVETFDMGSGSGSGYG